MFGKLKDRVGKIKAAGTDLFDQTQQKLSSRAFRVNGRKYKSKRLLAEGGFGYVYLVEDEMTGQLRALKHMIMQTRESRESTMREINLQASLPQSPYLVSMLGSEIVKGPPDEAFVVMELCTGGNLADIINAAGPGGRGLPETRIWEVFWQVCQAVAILHEQSPLVIHRDIKAENVLICDDGNYKLCDFGSAKREMVLASNDRLRNEIQEDIDRFTTLVYRSPEMVDLYMEKWISDKVDIWALGCLLFKMAFIVTPFEEGGRLGILNAKVEFPQTMNSSSYSEDLKATIKWLLTPDPDYRPNIFDVLERVAKIRGGSYNKKAHKAPQPPSQGAGMGDGSTHSRNGSTGNARAALLGALDWQSSDGSSTSQSQSSSQGFTSSDHRSADLFANHQSRPAKVDPSTFFSTPSFSTSASPTFSDSPQFTTTPSSTSDSWDPFGQTSASSTTAASPSISSTTQSPSLRLSGDSNINSSTAAPTLLAPSNASGAHSSASLAESTSSAIPRAQFQFHQPQQSPGASARSHRRSVSDSSAITATLMNEQHRAPASADGARIPVLVNGILTSDLKTPSLALVRELLTYTWAEPRQAHVSKVFQTLAPRLYEPQVALKGLYTVHRLLAEGSDLVLTLCINKLDFFKQLMAHLGQQTSHPEFLLLNERYATYLVKKLEFHAAFESCFEGSYSLDVYFNRLRIEGKKLLIGASDSPLRRQAVPALLELQTCALSLLDQFLSPASNNPDASSLKLHLCLPIFADLCSLLLLLQYTTTKLLATKTDFTKAIMQYEEQYGKMIAHFAKFAQLATTPLNVGFPATEAAWAASIKMPSFPPTAPQITKGSTSVASPPSLDPTVSPTPHALPQPLIFDALSNRDAHEALFLWNSLVHPGQQTPSASSSLAPTSGPTLTPSGQQQVPPHVSQRAPSLDTISRPAAAIDVPSFDPVSSVRSFTPPPQTFTPPPPGLVPSTGASSPTNAAPSFDPFHSSQGFTQGDPFAQISLTSSSGSISSQTHSANNADFGSDFGMFTPSTSASSATFMPSTANATIFDDSDFGFDHTLGAETDHYNAAQLVPMTPPPKRPLARSVDPSLSAGPSRTHKKRTSDNAGGHHHKHNTASSAQMSHALSSGMHSSGSDGTLTSEEKLKNKDHLNAQEAEFAVIQALPGNSVCFDCGDNAPKWLSLNLGVFICYRCSGIHRSFGTHISKVRSVQLDVLSAEQIAFFKKMGNQRAALIWLAHVPEGRTTPDRNSAQSELEKFLRDKYVFEEFKAKESASPPTPQKKTHSRQPSHQ